MNYTFSFLTGKNLRTGKIKPNPSMKFIHCNIQLQKSLTKFFYLKILVICKALLKDKISIYTCRNRFQSKNFQSQSSIMYIYSFSQYQKISNTSISIKFFGDQILMIWLLEIMNLHIHQLVWTSSHNLADPRA